MAELIKQPHGGALLPPPKPGEVRNPRGRPKAGAVVSEWYDAMAGWTLRDLERVLADPDVDNAQAAAARVWLDARSRDRARGVPIAGPELDRICDRTEGKAIARTVNVTHALGEDKDDEKIAILRAAGWPLEEWPPRLAAVYRAKQLPNQETT